MKKKIIIFTCCLLLSMGLSINNSKYISESSSEAFVISSNLKSENLTISIPDIPSEN